MRIASNNNTWLAASSIIAAPILFRRLMNIMKDCIRSNDGFPIRGVVPPASRRPDSGRRDAGGTKLCASFSRLEHDVIDIKNNRSIGHRTEAQPIERFEARA